MRDMRTPRAIAPEELVAVLNAGPGEPHEDVRSAAQVFDVNERTVYRRISQHGIRRVYRWELGEKEAA